ncbi:SUMO-activating enzyme subunit 2-like [Ornithodoros turicata]|uniref:SUMO-activating enzyme subunit 2-like n=1 Tax=Ornithodoros turicata TaxID=34597 RepID=UPI003138834F
MFHGLKRFNELTTAVSIGYGGDFLVKRSPVNVSREVCNMAGKALVSCVRNSKILVVGAGGIGCELLKNLVLAGFHDIEVIDLDTIDVSNLNRQFLFRKVHVGKSKSLVAKESAEMINPDAKIKAYHDSVIKPEYGLEFFKRFSIVMNALDNRGARSHVNRMCLAANVTLIESGTAGYLGQVTPIIKNVTECYECQPKPAVKTYPGCTIRNTPSEPIHCIVWAKHLFNQLFGEGDADDDVSPDSTDPELIGEVNSDKLVQESDDIGSLRRVTVSTRTWAVSCGYDPEKLFNKLFSDDISYLLRMDRLWKKRTPPTSLKWGILPDAIPSSSNNSVAGTSDQRLWSIAECGSVFSESLKSLKARTEALAPGDHLVWDKDTKDCLDFVTACSNLRAHCFGIPQKSRFDVKSMAGNIIPAIATTNAIIAGIIVLQAFKVLQGKKESCSAVYLNRQPNLRKKMIVPTDLDKPSPKCYACSSKAEIFVNLNTRHVTLQVLEDKILKEHLHMWAPDVEVDDGKGTILISSEEGETEGNREKRLADLRVTHGTRLRCDDFLQNFQLVINIVHKDSLEDGKEFEIVGDVSQPEPEQEASQQQASGEPQNCLMEDDDDLVLVEPGESRKRPLEDDNRNGVHWKRACIVVD